ncbi:MAG TPA: class I SAM-dependent methyltransferase [Chitinophagaceae bacterium]|nr:class I SAM-dependent methyltransferase [Chitinophagaceae bacterium]
MPVLKVKDHTVSKEIFEIWHCRACSGRFTQNVPSSAEIGGYYKAEAYVSHTDTSKGLINRMYHVVRNYTLQTKRKLVEKAAGVKKGNLLDVGAGTGAFAAAMQQAGWTVTGLEPDETARGNALTQHKLTLQNPGELFNFSPGSYNVITMWHVLEHVHELHHYLDTFHSLLALDGTLIIAVPNYTSYDAGVYKDFWAAYDVPRHLYHFSPQSMQQLAATHGFTVKQYRPMWFDSFYVCMLSEQYKNGGGLVKAVWNGLVSNLKAMGDVKKCSSVIYVIKKGK